MSDRSIVPLLREPGREGVLPVDDRFIRSHQANLDWLLDRLSKSTAGVRGLIAGTPALTHLTVEEAESTPQLSPTIVALIAQAYAAYFRSGGREGSGEQAPAAFVGFDARFLSREFGEIFTRVFAGSGVRVVRDAGGAATPTPVTSFMAVRLGLLGGIQITASHNPPNHNGVKSSTWYGGVDTDDVSDRIAEELRRLIQEGGEIRMAALPSPLVEEVDAKEIYARDYLRRVFSEADLAPLRRALEAGAGFLFDGLHGVGGHAMARYLDLLLPGADWRRGIHLLNAEPDPSIGGIEKPDPSDPGTLVESGAIRHLAAHPEVLVSVTADMDADRIGTAILIPADQVDRARRFGLFTSSFEGGVYAVRFTPNQVFTLIAYDRYLAARAAGLAGRSFHLLTTIASSVLAEQLAASCGLRLHLTAVGFKNLGRLARELDLRRTGDVILALMEESGGAQIGPFAPWNDRGDTIHRDKDTCALALALFNLAARLRLEGRGVLDFYLEMAERFGSLAYFERLDAYLPDRAVAEDPHRAGEANRAKEELLHRLVALHRPENHPALLRLFGFDPEVCESLGASELPGISLLVKEEGEWRTIHPRAHAYREPGGSRLEFYRAGPYAHDGMRIACTGPDGAVRHWCLVRASGTEALLRVYMEIVEPLHSPRPERLADQFEPLLRYLGLDRYRLEPHRPDYVTEFRETVRAKYGRGEPPSQDA